MQLHLLPSKVSTKPRPMKIALANQMRFNKIWIVSWIGESYHYADTARHVPPLSPWHPAGLWPSGRRSVRACLHNLWKKVSINLNLHIAQSHVPDSNLMCQILVSCARLQSHVPDPSLTCQTPVSRARLQSHVPDSSLTCQTLVSHARLQSHCARL